jgi:DNA gyrase inhibitor GyrI
MKTTVEEIRKDINDGFYYSGPDPTPAETYRRYCVILLGEIDRLENQGQPEMKIMGLPISELVGKMGIEPQEPQDQQT